MEEIDKHAKIVWDYMLMHQELKKSDLIFILGSNDLRVADRAAEIYKQGWAPIIICSGKNGKRSVFSRPEAIVFSERLMELGVPKEKIILEPNAMNTGENIIFTQNILKQKNMNITKIIAVQKPYMERRTYASIKKQWPSAKCIVVSPQFSYEDYFKNSYPIECIGKFDFKVRTINTMVGDLLRLKEYPKLGFQIEQDIPENVWTAGQELMKLGYNEYSHLISR